MRGGVHICAPLTSQCVGMHSPRLLRWCTGNRLQLVARCAVQIIEIVTSAESLAALITAILWPKVIYPFHCTLSPFVSIFWLHSPPALRIKTIASTSYISLPNITMPSFNLHNKKIIFILNLSSRGKYSQVFSLRFIRYIYTFLYCANTNFNIIILTSISKKVLNFILLQMNRNHTSAKQ